MNWRQIMAELRGASVPVYVERPSGFESRVRLIVMRCRDCSFTFVESLDHEQRLPAELAYHRKFRHK